MSEYEWKMFAQFCISMTITAGLAFAAYKVAKKVTA